MNAEGMTRTETGFNDGSQEKIAGGLEGKRVVVTRSAAQSAEMAKLLTNYGAEPVLYPCIEIIAPQSTNELDEVLLKAADHAYEWLVITSANTVEAIAGRLTSLGIILGDLRIAAIGPKTAASVWENFGIKAHFVASQYEAEALVDEMEVTSGQRVLLPQSERARPILAEKLTQKGAIVSAVVAYRTVKGEGGDDVPSLLVSGQIDAIIFTSASTVHYFLARIENEGAEMADLEGICLAAIGPVTADALREFSLSATVIPPRYTVPALVDALQEYFLQTSKMDLYK
jgi:uroporphyrinogen-III synthase